MLEQTDSIQQLQAAGKRLFTGTAKYLHLSKDQVFLDGKVREKFKVLEYHADATAQLGKICFRVADGDAVNDDFTFLEGFEGVNSFD